MDIERIEKGQNMKKIILKIRAIFFQWLHKPRMLNNIYVNPNGEIANNTRFSSTVNFANKQKIILGDNIYIGHNVVFDGTGCIVIKEGCQIASGVSILTHSSHLSIRLFGAHYSECNGKEENGYLVGTVQIGKYTFIGTNTIILPGVEIGKGCIVGANSLVNINLPDYAVAYGTPAKIIGDSRKLDKEYLENNELFQKYYNEWDNG